MIKIAEFCLHHDFVIIPDFCKIRIFLLDYMSRHVGAARGLRGAATWPCVPRRIHPGPAPPFFNFLFIFII